MEKEGPAGKLNRRSFLHLSALTAAGGALGTKTAFAESDKADKNELEQLDAQYKDILEVTIADLQKAMENGKLTSVELTSRYMQRVYALNQQGPELRAVLELNPDALKIANELDLERKAKGPRGPLHGIPLMLKDNIDTADRMFTTAGSIALIGSKPAEDATVAGKLRQAGAVILGKTNLSEWANFRSTRSTSGWSGRGRQNRNPYVLTHNPCGSSSGSAVAVSANMCVAALATETDGSIVCPAHQNGIVGIKPTVGLTSRAGVIPISHSQDSVGSHARTVTDAAILLGALVGVDPRDPATSASSGKFETDYTTFLDPNGLRGARIGVARKGNLFGYSPQSDAIIEEAIRVLKDQGATIVDPANIPTIDEINSSSDEITVLLYEFKADLNSYLANRVKDTNYPDGFFPRSLADLIAINQQLAPDEMPYFGQELFEIAQAKGPLTEKDYLEALANNRRRGGKEGLDAVLDTNKLDALVAPTGSPAWPTDLINGDHFLGGSSSPAAISGYPLVTVPAGYSYELPVGITFMGRAYSEPTLIKLAYAFEQATKARRIPRFLPTLDLP
jgi:amidase